MTEQQDQSLSELARAIERIERGQNNLSLKVDAMLVPFGVLQSQMNDLKPKVENMWWNAAWIAGATSAAVWVLARWIK